MPGSRSRRRTVPAQGHDAARGVQQQQLHARPRQHDDQRGSAAVHGRAARAASTTCPTMTVGILGMAFKARVGRHPLEPELQAEAAAAVQGRTRALHRPVRQRRPRPLAARRRARASPTCSMIATPHRAYADLARRRPRHRHVEPAAATASARVTTRASPSSSPSTTRATAIVACLDRLFDAITLPVRGARGVRLARRHDPAVPREVRARRRTRSSRR